MTKSVLVYSTARTSKCPVCDQYDCRCEKNEDKPAQSARIRIDRAGRKGKSVTIIEGLQVNPSHLAEIAKTIKQKLGVGGTAKEGRIEIQGEQRDKVATLLSEMGVKIKFSAK
ncbi:translation initiation factor [candidate division KSB1 bacterium]|nr:translation initiation factor [candidate division KSB1 bacterium]